MTAAECPNCRCRDMGGASGVVARVRALVEALEDGTMPRTSDTYSAFTPQLAIDDLRAIIDGEPKQPTEPTKNGYVGTLLSEYGSTHHVYRYLDYDGHAYRIVGLIAGHEARGLSWGVVLQAGKFTAVTS